MNEFKKPLVSVMIPAYNHERFVEEAILSVINQTYGYENIQLIVVDDCSSDTTPSILSDLESKYQFKLILHQHNMGICSTLNEMISLCEGIYITGFASDDIMVQDRIENQVNIMKKNSDFDILAGDSILIDKHGEILYKYTQNSVYTQIHYSFEDLFLSSKPRFAAGTAMYKNELFTRIGKYNPDFKIEDYYFWLKAAYNGAKIVKLNIPFLYYRVLNNSISSNERLMDEEGSKILSIYKNHPLYNSAKENREFFTLTKLIFKNKREVIQRLKRNPNMIKNKRIIKLLVMLILPKFILKKKFPENYFRNEPI